MAHTRCADPEAKGIAGDRLIDIVDPIAAAACTSEGAAPCHFTQPGGKIMQIAAIQTQSTVLIGEAIGHGATCDGMGPSQANFLSRFKWQLTQN
jgi:hypothetical protein